MGHRRPRPDRLGEKLRHIRETLDVSQPYMPARLGMPDMHPGRISEYECNEREPSLLTLLAYADLAGVHVEVLINDKVNLPEKLPGLVHHGVIPRDSREKPKLARATRKPRRRR